MDRRALFKQQARSPRRGSTARTAHGVSLLHINATHLIAPQTTSNAGHPTSIAAAADSHNSSVRALRWPNDRLKLGFFEFPFGAGLARRADLVGQPRPQPGPEEAQGTPRCRIPKAAGFAPGDAAWPASAR